MYFTLSDLVTDITQNAVESGADQVEVEIRETEGKFRVIVKDNGKGMDQEELDQAKDPFTTDGEKHPHRKIGLGIPLLLQTVNQSGGACEFHSQKNEGTTVDAWFDTTRVDTPPVGDISGLMRTILLFSGPREILVRYISEVESRKCNYQVRKSELAEVLGDLEDASSLVLLDQYLKSLAE